MILFNILKPSQIAKFIDDGYDFVQHFKTFSDSKVHGANMGPTWVLLAPDGTQVVPMNLAIRAFIFSCRVGVFFFIVMNMVFGNLSAVELFIKERAIFL